MKKLDPKLFSKVEIVAENVLRNLKKKGYVVPSLLENNTINFDGFIVGKDRDDLYFVKHVNREIKIPRINLPQTAALLANSLALGKNADEKLLAKDREYGFREFDKQIYKRAMKRSKNDVDRFIFFETRYNLAHAQARSYKASILNSFEKLRSIR
jgi:hypothetical protein